MVPKPYIFIYILLQFFSTSYALAVDNLPVSYLGIERGLSNNSVRCIYQDHNGYMWFGTYDGLNRFDGYEFKVFRNKLNDSASLPHNYIYTINEDLQHNLWIGTGQGIGIYNQLTSRFLPAYYIRSDNKQKEKITANVNDIKTDAQGNVFIGTNGWGLLVQLAGTDVAMQLLILKDGQPTTGYNVKYITVDKQQRVWVFINNVGLCRYDYSNKKIQLINNTVKSVSCLLADDAGNLWMGSWNGLFKYVIASNTIVQKYEETPGALTSDHVASLAMDKQNNLWIGTEGGGLNILNLTTGTFDYLLPGEGKSNLTSESVFSLYIDRESRKWMGTIKGGINVIDPRKRRFRTISHDPLNPNSLIYNFVSTFYEDQDKNLWIGTDGGGLSIWNRSTNHFTNFRHESNNSRSISNNSIICIKKDYLNNIWISTFGGGLNKFNRASNSFEHYRCMDAVTGEENKNTWLLLEDRDKNLWVTTFSGGKMYRLNRAEDRFEVFDQNLYDLFAIIEDRSGTLWVGNSHQLIKIDKQTKKHEFFEIGKPVRSIYEDTKGNFWVGAEGGGLILFDRKKGEMALRYSDADGLCNNAILTILEDRKGHLWLSTFNGLSEFAPEKKSFTNYYQDDGLQSNQFLYNAALPLQSGEFAFGGIKGFNIFYPDSINTRNFTPPLILTGLSINNTPVTLYSRYIAKIKDNKIQTLKIPYNDAVLSFDFAALEYSAPRKIAYAYYLQGWDKGWNYTGNLRTATYTHLNEGSYTLRIKSTNAEGVWNTGEIRIKVIVLPPWYRSWWAYTLYIILAGGAIVVYQRYRVRQSRLEYEVALAKVNAEKERAELEKERTEREKTQAEYEATQAQYEKEKAERETERVINEREKEINEKRMSFFTNISHEFRTPLTLIINPVKDLLQPGIEEGKKEHPQLNTVYRNARRLLSLVDQLLLFRKADAGADQLKISKLNFCSLCKEVYLAFVPQANALKIDYTFECAPEFLKLYGDREKIEIILYNLISNALKYTPSGGKVSMIINEAEDKVNVTVTDSGYGIPKEVGDKLFDKFYQVQEKGVPAKAGFGIGLYLVKHFVDSHKGKITYESELGKGTSFFIQLQKGKAHFGAQTIFEEQAEETVFLKELIENEETAAEPKAKGSKAELEALINENKTLLLIDDDEPLRQYIAQIFAHKYTVYQAHSGEEGLTLARQYLPDVIISDVNMQGISGIDLCKTIKEDPSLGHIPVILLTGSTSSETRLQGVEGGADDYITKPFEKDILVARVSSLLKSRTTLQKYFYNEITLQQNPLKISAEYKEFLEKCIAIVEQHLDDGNFSIKTLANEIGMSHSNLYKKVKSVSGQSVNAFIRFIRLRKAAELLISTNNNINETAFQVGFNDIKYFREQFAKLFGMKPSDYIKKYRNVFGKTFNLNEEGYKSEN